jgi:hypothetical protein
MEWVIACDQPFEEVGRPEFIAMMNYTHHSGTSLKIPKRDGIKRRLMKMGDDTVEDVHNMFSVRLYCCALHNILIPDSGVDSQREGLFIARRMDFKQSTCVSGHCRSLRVQ